MRSAPSEKLATYLLYLDRDGKEMTDSFQETRDQAFEQAAMEFGVSPSDWREE